MPATASRTSLFHRSALALSLAAWVAWGCSGGSEAPAKPAAAKSGAPATPADAKPKAASAAPASAPAATPAAAPASTPAKAGEAPAVAAKEGAPAPSASQPAAAPASAPAKDSANPAAAPPKLSTSKPSVADLTGTIAPNAPGAPAEAQPPKDKAAELLAKKGGDPLSQEPDPNSKAKLTYEFGSDSKNFGKCMQGDVLTHTFDLQSSGEEDLVIKQAKPTCGCTVAQVAAQAADGTMAPYNFGQPIPPGRKVEITATLHTQNKHGHAASRINIFSNDPRGQSQLGLEAEVDSYLNVAPANLNFNSLSARDTANDKVTVTTTAGNKIKLTAALENVPAGMKLELTPSDPDADGKSNHWELAAHLGPGLSEGNLSYSAVLRSDVSIPGGEKLPNGAAPTYEISVPIMAHVNGMISYSPAFISLGLIRPGQVVSRTVRVTSHDPDFKLGEPMKILVQGREGGDWDLASHFSTVIRPVAGENSIDVELRLDGMPETLNGSFSGQLTILVAHPEKPDIKLPITGVCRGGVAGTPAGGVPAPAPTPPK
jgi:hypothetical protein